MKVIIVFDILEEYRKVRDELRIFLKDFGGRFLQYSVYELDCDRETLEKIRKGIERILKKGGGRVDILLPCNRCYDKIKIIDTYEL